MSNFSSQTPAVEFHTYRQTSGPLGRERAGERGPDTLHMSGGPGPLPEALTLTLCKYITAEGAPGPRLLSGWRHQMYDRGRYPPMSLIHTFRVGSQKIRELSKDKPASADGGGEPVLVLARGRRREVSV